LIVAGVISGWFLSNFDGRIMTNGQTASGAFIVLGASGGIGSCVARDLRQQGHHVLLAARPSDRLTQLASELGSPFVPCDATRVSEVEAVFAEAEQTFGELQGAVNCVGSMLLKPAHLTKESEWQETLAANLTTAFATVQAAAKTMRQGGSIVLMSSAAARIGLANHEAIAAAKAGVIGLARSASATYAARSLRFNVVAPGLTKTKLTERIWNNPRSAAASQSMHGLPRLGEPEDVAAMISWLLNPANSWITGEVFAVDGGLSTVKTNSR
jgi:NAD(P)-dependent dehydrogenase (short-subunit alcohol dehydrogenase family)